MRSEGPAEFAGRVLRCGVLAGFEVAAFWPEPGHVEFVARHAYGPWRSVKVKFAGAFAESDRGCIVSPSDVASRLRRALKDRMPDQRQLWPR